MYAEILFSFWNVLLYMHLHVHAVCLPPFLVKGKHDVFTKDATSDLLLSEWCSVSWSALLLEGAIFFPFFD